MKCWVVIEGGYDWEEVEGVYLSEEDANKAHSKLVKNIEEKRKSSPNGYGVSLIEAELKTP
jgi:hypothetical protein